MRAEHALVEANVDYAIMSLIGQGCVALAQARWQQDSYQHIESLIYLAECLSNQKQSIDAHYMLGEARQLAAEKDLFDLLGRIERVWGEDLYRQGAFNEACAHLVASCHSMTLYSQAEYRLALQHLIDALSGLLDQEITSAASNIIVYWHTHHLAEAYPEVLTVCQGFLALL